MEVRISSGQTFSAEVRRCIGCKDDGNCKLKTFMTAAGNEARDASDLSSLAAKAGLTQGLKYGNVVSQGTESH